MSCNSASQVTELPPSPKALPTAGPVVGCDPVPSQLPNNNPPSPVVSLYGADSASIPCSSMTMLDPGVLNHTYVAKETLQALARSSTTDDRASMTVLSIHSGLQELTVLNDAITALEKV